MCVFLSVWQPLFVCQVQYVCPGVCGALLCVPVCVSVALREQSVFAAS